MTEPTTNLSKVNANDIELLRDISIQTFTETFAHQNQENDMRKYISENLSIDKLKLELSSENCEFYFLKLSEQIVGYLKLNIGEAQTELKNSISLEIERIYVKQEFHGKHFGKQLLQKAIEIGNMYNYQYIWLAVWEHNLRAIAFYTKHGFVEFDKHSFQLGDDVQLDIMMKMNLN